jgi:methylase of polypeptide subunit release factors
VDYLLIYFVCALDVLRLDLQHYGIQYITKRRYFAPLDEPRHAIDLGTGSGIWIRASISMHIDFMSYLQIDF